MCAWHVGRQGLIPYAYVVVCEAVFLEWGFLSLGPSVTTSRLGKSFREKIYNKIRS